MAQSYATLNLLAKGNIPVSAFVKLSTATDNGCLAAGANEQVIGISQEGTHDAPGLTGSSAYAAVAGQNILVFQLGDVCPLTAGSGGWTRGDSLKSDSTGKGVVASSVGDKVGAIALESALEGEVSRVLIVLTTVAAATSVAVDATSLATANYAVTAGDNGKTFLVGAADLVATLPATAAGLHYRFIVMALSTVTGFSVSPAAADKITGNGFTPADNKDAINSAATDAIGDKIDVLGDGVDGWIITDVTGTWAREG